MKNHVKTPVLFTILLFSLLSASAQIKLPAANPVAPDMKRVMADYNDHFSHLLGELIVQNPQSTDYKCIFNLNGAESTTITVYTSSEKTVASWQSLVLTTEDFDKAKKKFHSLYNQLNNLAFQINGGGSYRLKGEYQAPVEEKKFGSVVFTCNPADESSKKIRVEISLQYELLEWKLSVLVYEKEREDTEGVRF